jgi:hypothetical protein
MAGRARRPQGTTNDSIFSLWNLLNSTMFGSVSSVVITSMTGQTAKAENFDEEFLMGS